MKALKERIVKDGIVKPGHVLKVDSFLNHQIDVALMDEIGKELAAKVAGKGITKVLTIEVSGVAIACAVARQLGVPVVFAKKSRSINLDGEVYEAQIPSFTSKKTTRVIVAKKFIQSEDKVFIVDDFLANGYAMQGLISIVESADAKVEALGIVIEKSFQEGGHRLRNLGYELHSLAIIEEMNAKTGTITFTE